MVGAKDDSIDQHRALLYRTHSSSTSSTTSDTHGSTVIGEVSTNDDVAMTSKSLGSESLDRVKGKKPSRHVSRAGDEVPIM